MPNKKLKTAAMILFVVIMFGTIGFALIEKLNFLDALYMTVITVSTVGYREIVPFSNAGKVFAIFFITIGVGTVFYAVGTFINVTIQDYFQNTFGRRRMDKKIQNLEKHYIITGFGRVGVNVAQEFKTGNKKFVVIEKDPSLISDLQELGYDFVEGDATDDEILLKAGVEMADGLVAALQSDADNVFVVLSAKSVNPNIFIVARANTLQAIDKLKTAGADRVVSPSVIGGRRMAAWLLRPVVSDYLDLVSHGSKLEYRLEEIEVQADSLLENKTIAESDIRGKTGSMILAIKSGDNINTNPKIETKVKADDLLIVIGTDEQLKSLEKMA